MLSLNFTLSFLFSVLQIAVVDDLRYIWKIYGSYSSWSFLRGGWSLFILLLVKSPFVKIEYISKAWFLQDSEKENVQRLELVKHNLLSSEKGSIAIWVHSYRKESYRRNGKQSTRLYSADRQDMEKASTLLKLLSSYLSKRLIIWWESQSHLHIFPHTLGQCQIKKWKIFSRFLLKVEVRGSVSSRHVGRVPDFNVYEPNLFESIQNLRSAKKPVSTGMPLT
jgi:hypothetical protein